MNDIDMREAVSALAEAKGLDENELLQVLVQALALAYKRRPDAADG